MKAGTLNIDLDFSQILGLVKQLTKKEKIKLSRELEKEIIDAKLTSLLKAFKTDELDQATIDREVEIVRSALYAKSKAK
ncbi:MAG: type II toxin-antitoxin system VapB15 family antitoxin [Bacteroidota bacterium]